MIYKQIDKYQNNNINTILDNLKRKIRNFAVLDTQGELIGRVKDLIIDSHHQLNIIITLIAEKSSSKLLKNSEEKPYFLLASTHIHKIELLTKSVFIDINKDQLLLNDMSENSSHLEITNGNQKLEMPNSETANMTIKSSALEQNAEAEIIRLLGERLIVDRSKRKVGDVIVRKQIETRMIQVPVRREKLIIEQVGPEPKQLAEIDLCQGEISDLELIEPASLEGEHFDAGLTVSGDFNSPKIASLLLNAIALERNHGCHKVRVTISVDNEEHQRRYQEWFERTSTSKTSNPENQLE